MKVVPRESATELSYRLLSLSSKLRRHELRVELEHAAVSRIGIGDHVVVRKTLRRIVRVLGWHHAIALAVPPGVLVKNLRFPSYLPESSCDLFPISDAIVVPTNES